MRSKTVLLFGYIVYHLRRKSATWAKFGKNKPFFALVIYYCTRVSDSITRCWLSMIANSLDTVSGSLASAGGSGRIFSSRLMASTCTGFGFDTPASQFWIVRDDTPTICANSFCEKPSLSLACFTSIVTS